MQRKKMTLRFNLDRPEDRQAWEYLRKANAVSMNRAVLDAINQVEERNQLKDLLRSVMQEELAKQTFVQQVPAEPSGVDGAEDTILDFLESFT